MDSQTLKHSGVDIFLNDVYVAYLVNFSKYAYSLALGLTCTST